MDALYNSTDSDSNDGDDGSSSSSNNSNKGEHEQQQQDREAGDVSSSAHWSLRSGSDNDSNDNQDIGDQGALGDVWRNHGLNNNITKSLLTDIREEIILVYLFGFYTNKDCFTSWDFFCLCYC